MARLALLSSVILLLLGVTLAAEDSPPLDPDPDPYQVAASRSEIVVARQLLDPQATTEGATGKLQGRRRRLGARRRRPLDPERRRQLLLRRQQLGLPLRRRLRPLQEGKSPSTTTTAGPTTITTTTQAPLTSTSTSSSFSSSSVSSSSSSSTTLRSVFPSFSLASRLRTGADRRPSWGSKTPSEETRKKEEEEEREEEKDEPEPKDLAELTSPGDLKERRRGVSKILNRPVHRRLTPTIAPTLVTTPTTPRRDREERLRFRPLLSGKRVRVGRRKNTSRPRPTVSSSTTTATIPTTTATITTTTTTTTAAPTSSLPPPPTTTTDAPLVHHRDSPDFWQDSSTTLHIDSSTPHPEVSIFDQDSLAFLQDQPVVFQPDSPSFDYDYDSPTIPPDSSVFGPDVFPPPPPTFLPAPRSAPLPSKPRHTPVPKKVNIAPQPSWPRHPKFLPIRRFKPEAQDVKSIVPKPKYVPLDSRPSLPSFTPPPSPGPVTRQGDHVVNEDSNRFVTHRPRHFEPALSLIRGQDGFKEEGQGNLDVFPSHVAKQNGFEIPERSRFDPFSSFVSQESISQPKPDHFDAFPSLVAQVTPQPNFVTRERNFIPENPNFLNQNPNYEPDREVLQSAFTPRPREHFREPPARTTTDHTAARHTGFLQTRRHSTPRPHPLLHDSELVYAPQADFDDAADPLYHTEVIYTPDQGDGGYDEADAPVYEDEDIQSESDYEEDYKEPGVLDHYKYGYQVDSEDTGNFQQRYEARDGATVSGSYKVALPDGRVQVVTYVADDGGFRAEVSYEGEETPTVSDPKPSPTPAPIPPSSPHPTIETPPAAAFPLSSSRRPAPPRLAIRRPRLPHSRATKKNLHFSEHVTTASPNPFRLVVEGGRASTHAPPTPARNTNPARASSHVTTSPVFRDVEEDLPSSSRRKYAPTTTNAHTIAPPHSLTHGPSSSTLTTTTAPPPSLHTPTPRYEYNSLHNKHTILYAPTTDATAYIHTLGRSHAVPVLLPLPPTHPRTYFLNNAHDREGDSVEIQRGDASRPRISIHTPSPHQTDIYPSPRPPLFRIP